MARKIFMTKTDRERLQKLIIQHQEFNQSNEENLRMLEQELLRAEVVSSEEIPHDVITMNSKVVLVNLDTGKEMNLSLVYPVDAALLENKVSVLAPVGMAILGYREGDIIDWHIPSGMVQLEVKKILYQPEAAGDMNL